MGSIKDRNGMDLTEAEYIKIKPRIGFYLTGILKAVLKQGDGLSDSSGAFSEEVREQPGYIKCLQKKKQNSSQNIERLLLIKEKPDCPS